MFRNTGDVIKMICENCIHFWGLQNECKIGEYVADGLEATYCDDYLYDGECKE